MATTAKVIESSSQSDLDQAKTRRMQGRQAECCRSNPIDHPLKETEYLGTLEGSEDANLEGDDNHSDAQVDVGTSLVGHPVHAAAEVLVQEKMRNPSILTEALGPLIERKHHVNGRMNDSVEGHQGLSLQIEVNLDIELHLTARIKGDISVAIL